MISFNKERIFHHGDYLCMLLDDVVLLPSYQRIGMFTSANTDVFVARIEPM